MTPTTVVLRSSELHRLADRVARVRRIAPATRCSRARRPAARRAVRRSRAADGPCSGGTRVSRNADALISATVTGSGRASPSIRLRSSVRYAPSSSIERDVPPPAEKVVQQPPLVLVVHRVAHLDLDDAIAVGQRKRRPEHDRRPGRTTPRRSRSRWRAPDRRRSSGPGYLSEHPHPELHVQP